MENRILFQVLQLRNRLWAKPLLYCLLAVGAAFLAQLADGFDIASRLPPVTEDTIQTLLTIISSTMLAVATFAVGSMVSAYHSASSTATPRAFALVLADDVSKTALSSFIGAFIFSIVAIVALKTGLYGPGGRFVLFLLTLAIFAWVILTFVRWVDNIARLGRLGTTVDKAEAAAARALRRRRDAPCLGGVPKTGATALDGARIFADRLGYVQYVDVQALQEIATSHDLRIMVDALPGAFIAPNRALAVLEDAQEPEPALRRAILRAFVLGDGRTFEEDPRFGLVVLSEIAARALSPGVNDPGTAIVIVGRFIRLFALWSGRSGEDGRDEETGTSGGSPPRGAVDHDRVIVPPLALSDMFDDAFTAIARDGAGIVEVGIRLQKAFRSLADIGDPALRHEALRHSAHALDRAERALGDARDRERLKTLCETVGG